MDGLPDDFRLDTTGPTMTGHGYGPQRTLAAAISCVGIGLHTGRKVTLTLCPAPPDSGVVIRRTDLGIEVPARYDHVIDTRLCTVLGLPEQPDRVRVGTVEHIMAALAGCGVHNAGIELDAPEMPVLDGSSQDWVFLIDCAGIAEQDAPVVAIEVLRPVRVFNGEAYAELRPGMHGFRMSISIDFKAVAIGRQSVSLRLGPAVFRTHLARARTFALADEVEQLRAAGLARGGSLENAVVVDGARVLNPGGLRWPDEFARHKALDVIGDLALAGAVLHGRYLAHRPGHTLNNRLLRALFADAANWRLATRADTAGAWQSRLPAAAAAA
jgi:UDP-3-O-[3-hydroxymyristoyl] N-acetylglucosamine deacetylase